LTQERGEPYPYRTTGPLGDPERCRRQQLLAPYATPRWWGGLARRRT